MSASVTRPNPEARTVARVQRRHIATEKRRLAAQQRAEQQEQRDEAVAPAAQRLPVLGRDGEIIRGARVERDGIVFIRSNPIRRMVARGQGKDRPLLSKRHADAADRLLRAFEEGGAGVTNGVAQYDVRIGGTPSSGTIADSVLRAVNRQIAARTEIEAVKTRLGARWGCVFSIVIAGIDVSAWGEAVGFNPATSGGYLAACLDILVDFYTGPARHGRIRAVEFESRGEREAAD